MKHMVAIILLCISVSVFAQTKNIKPLEVEKGEMLFSDDFERQEGLGDWTVHEKFNGAFETKAGKWITKEIEGAGHGSTARIELDYSDVVIEFDFMFDGGKRFNMVMDDSKCKSVWAGHISRVSFSKNGFYVRDDKTGNMDLKIRNQIKDNPEKKVEMKAFLDSKMASAKFKFNDSVWYHVVITKKGHVLHCQVEDVVAQLKSEGISHPNLNKFGPTITGADILFDNITICAIK